MKGCSENGHWVGVDWGESNHAIAIVDRNRKIKKQFQVPHSAKGMTTLSETLRSFQPILGIAIESSRNLIFTHLLEEGYSIYSINPKISSAWRKNNSVSCCKSDDRDGLVLALELSMRWELLCPMRPESAEMRTLAMFCEEEQKLITERTRHALRLKNALRTYYPASLEFFSDWAKPVSWRWFQKYRTPDKLAKASEKSLYKFLRENRVGISKKWEERVANAVNASDFNADKATCEVYEERVLTEVAQLLTIEEKLVKYRKRIEGLFANYDEHTIFDSLPGAGKKLAPRLFAIFGDDRERYNSVEPIRLLSGVAPVMKQSGRSSRVTIRRACKKLWRNTMFQFADKSKKYCVWAKAFYDYRRAAGDGYAQALRKLADKWLKIIYRMWRDGIAYNDKQYMESLRKRKSPLIAYIPVDNPVENC